MIELQDRVLLNTGISVVPDSEAIDYLLKRGELPDYIKVVESKDAELYEEKYQKEIIFNELDSDIQPDTTYNYDKFNELIEYLYGTFRDNTDPIEHKARLDDELGFFIDGKYQYFLLNLSYLVKKFKENKEVWGGRGSSCSSYVLYILEIHSINPIKYNIDFNEFAKRGK